MTFLATTGLSEFWDRDQDLLFLGSWCLPPEPARRYPLLQNPWEEPSRFREACSLLDEAGERLLASLADHLNRAHGLSWSRRTWRVVVGPWLMQFLHTLYDRHARLEAAMRAHPDLATWVLDPADYRTPRDSAETMEWVLGDRYNLQLVSELLAAMGRSYPARRLSSEEIPPAAAPSPLKRWVRGAIVRHQRWLHWRRAGNWETAVCEAYLTHGQAFQLARKSRYRCLPVVLERQFPLSRKPGRHPARSRLADMPARSPFERIAAGLFPTNLPRIYLEEFTGARAWIRRVIPDPPPVLLSGNGWYFHDPLQFLAAEVLERGGQLIGDQHGGGYGMYEAAPQEDHERRICDRYGVWGWADAEGPPAENWPSPALSDLRRAALRQNGRKDAARPLLLVSSTNPRYFYRFYSSPQAETLQAYFGWAQTYLEGLTPAVRGKMRFREHRHPYGHHLRERWSPLFPELAWDKDVRFERQLLRSALVILDHPSTPMLQALAADIPCILFWDPRHWGMRPSAQPTLAQLREAGILFHRPEEAAEQTLRVLEDPEGWWRSPSVKEARRSFIGRYALCDQNWSGVWWRKLQEGAHPPTERTPSVSETRAGVVLG